MALLVGLYVVYRTGRLAVAGEEKVALRHARGLHRLQRLFRLPLEADLQAVVASRPLFRVANEYYVGLHLPLIAAFLIVGLLVMPRAEYVWARRILVTQTFTALVLDIVLPVAPQRMFSELGFVDTMASVGPSPNNGVAASVANQYAAMPSLHVGWAALIAYVAIRTGPRWLAVAASIHAVLTVFVVIATANHWWLDGVVGNCLVAVAAVVFSAPTVIVAPRPASPQPVADPSRGSAS